MPEILFKKKKRSRMLENSLNEMIQGSLRRRATNKQCTDINHFTRNLA